MSKNTNCLEGVKCPQCGYEDDFRIKAEIMVFVTDEGTQDELGGYEWDKNAYCQCGSCDHEGILDDFTVREETP